MKQLFSFSKNEKVPSQGVGGQSNIATFDSLYKAVCVERPQDYSYYTQFDINWGSLDSYEVVQKLGRGKYSEVFEGCNHKNNQKCVIKILKPVRSEKINRESKH
jgi:casein kinase II subunit alpha